MDWISVIGVVIALFMLAFLCMKGVNVYVVAIIAAAIVIIFGRQNLYTSMMEVFAAGFANFLGKYLFLFILGSIFGKLMDISGAARKVAESLIKIFGKKNSLIALPIAVGCLAYGGINGYVAIFASLPIMLLVFEEADLPRRFIPAVYLFGAGTFANAGPGSPQILNIICTQALGLTPMAGALPGFVGSGTILIVGIIWLNKMVSDAVKNNEHFDKRSDDTKEQKMVLPSAIQAFIPLIVVLASINIIIDGKNLFNIETAMFIGCISVLVACFNTIKFKELFEHIGEGCKNGFSMVGSVCAMVGFGNVISASPAFETIINAITNLPGPPLVMLALAMNVMCALTATASGASGIVAPILGPIFVNMGVNPNAVARVMAISATGFDSVPHNGTIVAIIHDICHETHKTAYKPVFNLCVVTPLIGTAAAIIVCMLIY